MTLLLTCVTQHLIVQASDRRLTTVKGKIAEELSNKAVMWERRATFAYTGLARLGGQPTDELLLDSLADTGPDFAASMRALATRATVATRNTLLHGVSAAARPAIRRTSFVGAGFLGLHRPALYGRTPTQDELHPALFVVSNAQDLTEAWRATADREYQVHTGFLPEGALYQLHTAGQALLPRERVHLERALRRAVARVEGPEPIARLLARAIRTVSARTATVGPNVTCTLVRRCDARSTSNQFGGGLIPIAPELMRESEYFRRLPGEQGAMWIYSPAEPTALVHYAPSLAIGGILFKGMLVGPAELVP